MISPGFYLPTVGNRVIHSNGSCPAGCSFHRAVRLVPGSRMHPHIEDKRKEPEDRKTTANRSELSFYLFVTPPPEIICQTVELGIPAAMEGSKITPQLLAPG